MPNQNLFMLVSALMGLDRMKDAYAYAIENGYRFYSYGTPRSFCRENVFGIRRRRGLTDAFRSRIARTPSEASSTVTGNARSPRSC